MDSKRRFKLRGQTVPEPPKTKGRAGRMKNARKGIHGNELDFIPFYEIQSQNLNASQAASAYAAELRRQGHEPHIQWAITALLDGLHYGHNSVIARMIEREFGIARADASEIPRNPVLRVTMEPRDVEIPQETADAMAYESEAESIFQNMVAWSLSIEEMRRTVDNLQRVRPERGYIYRRVRERIALYGAVERGEPISPLQIIQAVAGIDSQFAVDPPRPRAPRQVDPVIRNAARPRAAPRGGLPPAMLQRTDRNLQRRMDQFVEECRDMKDQNIRLTNAGRAEDAQMILNQFHAYRQDIGSFPEVGAWRERAQQVYDDCWNQMFSNRMRYDGSRGVRRINRRKP